MWHRFCLLEYWYRLVNYIWGDRIAEWIPGGIERTEQIFWTLWYLFMIAMMMVGNNPVCPSAKTEKRKEV